MLYNYEKCQLQQGFGIFVLKNGKIHFFTGKGGVGKSSLSIAFAKELAEQGLKTLWLEFSQTPTLRHFSEVKLSHNPTYISENLDAASWNGEDCLQEFVKYSVKLRLIYETFYRSKAINALIKAAPALREIAFLGYLTSHLRDVEPSLSYDQVVVDAPSTGHFLACLKVPGALLDISDFGPMGFHCRGILEVLQNPEKTSIYSIFLAEPLVVLEHRYMQSELSSLGLQSLSWMNKAISPSMIEELQSIKQTAADLNQTSETFKNKLLKSYEQQQQILKDLSLKNLLMTFDSDESSLKKQVKFTVGDILNGN
jgi:anion-transporting  ArsA/GET3 family ATPase